MEGDAPVLTREAWWQNPCVPKYHRPLQTLYFIRGANGIVRKDSKSIDCCSAKAGIPIRTPAPQQTAAPSQKILTKGGRVRFRAPSVG